MANEVEIRVPDIGDFEDVEVVEVLVAKGDRVELEDPLISIESDKATMELPSPHAGEIVSVDVAVGDRVSQGVVIARIAVAQAPDVDEAEPEAPAAVAEVFEREPRLPGESPAVPPPAAPYSQPAFALPHASPLVRRIARELGVDLSHTHGSGPMGRIVEDDLKAHVRERMQSGGLIPALGSAPRIDFAEFGEVETVPLSRIHRIAAQNLTRAWVTVPHVTQHDEADVSELERFRKQASERASEAGTRLSPLVFVLKATAQVLQRFPDFRSSLAPDSEALIVKNYLHIGVAVDTQQGLVVPVVRDVDRKGILELARELADTAERARHRKLSPDDLRGGVFSISSLGGIGGTAFTPIINAPEVAVLGLSRLVRKPVWDPAEGGGQGGFVPRTLLPLSLSYDHRVIDGAAAVRFTTELARVLSQPANLLL